MTIDPKVVAETVQFFITAMDSLKLNMNAIDQVLFTPLCVCACACASAVVRVRVLRPGEQRQASVRLMPMNEWWPCCVM